MEYDLTVIVCIQIIIFLVLVLLLRQIIFSASARELKRLRELSQENERKAEQLAKELEKAEREHQRKVAKAEAELRELKASLREEAQGQKENALKKAREEGDKIVSQALGVRDRIRAEAEEQLGERSVQLACSMVGRALTDERMKWFHDGLVDDIAVAIEAVDRDRLGGLQSSGDAIIKTPYELSDKQMAALCKALSAGLGREISAVQSQDSGVVAGVTITLGSLMIDGSLAGKLRQVSVPGSDA